MTFITIELFYYDNRAIIWLSFFVVLGLLGALFWRVNKRIGAEREHESESLKIKRPMSPIESFIKAREAEIMLHTPTLEERAQLVGELKGSVTAITAFAQYDPDTLPVPLDEALQQLLVGKTEAAETILRDRLESGRGLENSGQTDAEKDSLAQMRSNAAKAARNLAAFVLLRDPGQASALYDEAVALDDTDAALWRRNGDFKLIHDDLDGAQKAYKKAFEISDIRNETHQKAAASLGLGRVAKRKGQNKKAVGILEDALIQAYAINRHDLAGTIMRNLGDLFTQNKQFEDAAIMFTRASKADQLNSNHEGVAKAYHGLGRLAMIQNDLKEAEKLMNQGFDVLTNAGSPPLPMATILGSLGEVHHKQGDFEQADDALQAAMDFAASSGNESYLADLLHECGVIYFSAGALKRAEKCHGKSLLINQKLKRNHFFARQCWALGNVYKSCKDFKKALVLGKQAEQLYRASGDLENALILTKWINGVRAADRI